MGQVQGERVGRGADSELTTRPAQLHSRGRTQRSCRADVLSDGIGFLKAKQPLIGLAKNIIGLSVGCNRKTQRNFLANPIFPSVVR